MGPSGCSGFSRVTIQPDLAAHASGAPGILEPCLASGDMVPRQEGVVEMKHHRVSIHELATKPQMVET